MQGKAAAAIHPSSRWRTGSSQSCLHSKTSCRRLYPFKDAARTLVHQPRLVRSRLRCDSNSWIDGTLPRAAALDAPSSCSRQEQQSALMHATARGARRCGALSRRISLLRCNFCTAGVLRSKRAAQRVRRRSTPPPRCAAALRCTVQR